MQAPTTESNSSKPNRNSRNTGGARRPDSAKAGANKSLITECAELSWAELDAASLQIPKSPEAVERVCCRQQGERGGQGLHDSRELPGRLRRRGGGSREW